MRRLGGEVDQWERLETYRQRYPIEDRLGPVLSLEKSMARRRFRSAMLQRRSKDLREQLAQTQSELDRVETELTASRDIGALLIEEIIEQIRAEMGEAWSPTPVKGFRVCRIQDNRVMGNQVHWPSPTLRSRCLRDLPGEDLPHPVSKCGPPACGIYALKHLDLFGRDIVTFSIDRLVVGVVAMTGKVVEHEAGYRSQTTRVVAMVARHDPLFLMSDDTNQIEDFFADPYRALGRGGVPHEREQRIPEEFLKAVQSEEEKWI